MSGRRGQSKLSCWLPKDLGVGAARGAQPVPAGCRAAAPFVVMVSAAPGFASKIPFVQVEPGFAGEGSSPLL